MVNLNNIGVNSKALMCLTRCCASSGLMFEPTHNWKDPTGLPVSRVGGGLTVSERLGALLLHRHEYVKPSHGVYTCIIPDINFKTRHLYILGYTSKTPPGQTKFNFNELCYSENYKDDLHD